MEKKLSLGSWIKSSCREWQKHASSIFGVSLVVTSILYAALVLLVNKATPEVMSAKEALFGNNQFLSTVSHYSFTEGYNLTGDIFGIGYLAFSFIISYALTKFVWNSLLRRHVHAKFVPEFLQESVWFLLGFGSFVALTYGVMKAFTQVVVLSTQAGYPLSGIVALVIAMLCLMIIMLRSLFLSWALADGAPNALAAVITSFAVTRNNFWRFFAALLVVACFASALMFVGGVVALKLTLISPLVRLVWVIFINAFFSATMTIASGCLYKQLRDNAKENGQLV